MALFLAKQCKDNTLKTDHKMKLVAENQPVSELQDNKSWVHLYLCEQDDTDIYVDGDKRKDQYPISSGKAGTDIKFGPNEGRCKANFGINYSNQLQGGRGQSGAENGVDGHANDDH